MSHQPSIHPTSVISSQAEIAPDVKIGPFCVVKGRVKIGAGSILESHVSLGNDHGIVQLGERNVLHSGAAVGGPPQDLSYRSEPTRLELGNDNVVREFATINCGTPKGGALTQIGDHCLIMSYAHVAHDCKIGNHVVIANSTQLAGHVVFEDHVKVGGMCGFNQFVRVGKYAFIAGDAAVNKDLLPFTISQGKYAVMRACNSVGLERAGFLKEDIESINRAIRIVTKGGGTIEESIARITIECQLTDSIQYLLDFMKNSSRGIAI
jgi:UDP-N-acetylglucosamine acyltransferase